MQILLISNSTQFGGGYLEHCRIEVEDFLGPAQRVLFIGYALHDQDAYAAKVAAAMTAIGRECVSIHAQPDGIAAVRAAEAIFVGGGNTFRLLNRLYAEGLIEPLGAAVAAGARYMGASAGSNVACHSIQTTNDMPIVQPPSFLALQLVPFCLNPHYLDPDPGSRHMGETRAQRIAEFHEMNDTPVMAIREGAMLRIEGRRMELRGQNGGVCFRRGEEPQPHRTGSDLSFLLA